jgi:hypothetical protein
MLEVKITAFFQGWQKEFVGISEKAKGIWFVWISFGKGIIVWLRVLWETEIDASDIDEIEDIV